MKNLLQKTKDQDDSGIAIIFSLMMMAIFLVMGMGFAGYMTNVRRASTYLRDAQLNDGVNEIVKYQVQKSLEGVFGVNARSSADYEANYYDTMPEASLTKFDSVRFKRDSDDYWLRDNQDNYLELPIWGKSVSSEPLAFEDDLHFDYLRTKDSTDSYEATYIASSTFTPPTAANVLGWETHRDEDDISYAMSSWAVIAMSGRIDPAYFSDTARASLTPDDRVKGESIAEMSLTVLESDSEATTYKGMSTLAALQANVAAANSNSDTAMYAYMPGTQSETDADTVSRSTLFNLADLADNSKYGYAVSSGTDASTQVAKVTDATNGIKYLSGSTGTEDQIAANLIDYSDSDIAATTNLTFNVDGSVNQAADYFGNESAPCMTQIILEAEPKYTGNQGSGEFEHLNIEIKAEIQLQNLYASTIPIPTGSKLKVRVEVVGVDNSVTLVATNLSADKRITLEYTVPSTHTAGTTYQNATPLAPSTTIHYDLSSYSLTNRTMTSLSVRIVHAVLYDSTGAYLWDYADIDQAAATQWTGVTETVPESMTVAFTGDPRFNMTSSDWGTGTYTWAYANSSTVDNEPDAPAGDAHSLSTNFVRNAAMKSLHELGYIHRGAKFQTLNLVEYNSASEAGTQEMGAYSSTQADEMNVEHDGGDRSILNHVSVDGNDETTPSIGRLNPNTTNPEVLQLLLSNISAGHPSLSTDYVGTGGKEITDAKISALKENFPGYDSSTPHAIPSFPTTQYFEVEYFKNKMNNPPSYGIPFKLTTELTDREAEVLLCNTRRLVSVSQNFYMAIVEVRTKTGITDPADAGAGVGSYRFFLQRELVDDENDDDPTNDTYTVKIIE